MLPILLILTQHHKNRKPLILFGFAIMKKEKVYAEMPFYNRIEGHFIFFKLLLQGF